jgi:ankyrin repeat protein
MCTFNTDKNYDFNSISFLVQLPKLNSNQINTLSNVIHAANQEKGPCTLSFQELKERITILEKIDHNVVIPERKWYFHICTFCISYLFAIFFDASRAETILQQKQSLVEKYREQYFEQLFKAIDSDPTNVTHILKKLETSNSSDIEKILIYGLKAKNKEIVIKCRERLQSVPLNDKYYMKNLDAQMNLIGTNHFNILSIKQLIEEGADIDRNNHYSTSPIFSAVASNKIDVVNMLIEAGANLNSQGYLNIYSGSRISLLQRAILNDNQEIALNLLQAGARDDGAFIEAAARGHLDFISAYLKLDVDSTVKTKALMGAINNGQTKAALCLINAGTDVNVVVPGGKSAAWLAATHQDLNLLRAIQEKGGHDDLQAYALMTAIKLNHESMYPEFMKAVTSNTINQKNSNDKDNTLLMTSAAHGRISMVRELINLSADLNAQNKEGYSALMLALKNNRVDIALILIDAGARCDLVAPSGETALSLTQHPLVLKALSQALKLNVSI